MIDMQQSIAAQAVMQSYLRTQKRFQQTIIIDKEIACTFCAGTGESTRAGFSETLCTWCKGTGILAPLTMPGDSCTTCNGSGIIKFTFKGGKNSVIPCPICLAR